MTMRKRFTTIMVLAVLLAATTGVRAADAERGRQLNAAHCGQCHDDGLYRSGARKAKSVAQIAEKVRKGEQALGLGWSDADVADVTEFLNSTYYRLAR